MEYNGAAWLQAQQIPELQHVAVHDERSAVGTASNDWKEVAASVQGAGINDFLGDLQGEHEYFWTDAGHSDALQASGGPLERTPSVAHPSVVAAHHSPTPPLNTSSNPYALLLSTAPSYGPLPSYPSWIPTSAHLSNYSTLNGANSSSSPSQPHTQTQGQSQGQGQGQGQSQGHSPMVIDPALTTMNGSSSSPPQQYQQPAYLYQSVQPRMQYPYSQPTHQSMLSINPSFVHSGPSQFQQSPPSQTQHPAQLVLHSHSSSQQQQQQTTLSPFVLHSPSTNYYSSISPASFYGQSAQSLASHSSSASPASQATPQSVHTPPPTSLASKPSTEQQRAKLVTDVKPFIQSNSFTGGGAVAQLVNIIDDYGIAGVDAQIRLEILTKIRDNAGNHYFRAWVDNSTAMDVAREWLKLGFVGRDDEQMVETIMPLLQIIDRLPLTLEKLKQSKLGRLIMKLIKEPPTPAIKDMAANLEIKWRKMLSQQEVPDKAETEETEDSKGRKRRAEPSSSKSAPPVKKAAVPLAGSSMPKAVPVKKESKPVVKDAKSDSSFFSKPKPTKKELPSFKKTPAAAPAASGALAPGKKPDANVAQPSSVNGFQEILRSWAGPSTSTPPPASGPGPSTGPAVGPSGAPPGVLTLGKRKKSVTWAPDSKLEQIKFIERAVYDDDGASVSVSHLHRRMYCMLIPSCCAPLHRDLCQHITCATWTETRARRCTTTCSKSRWSGQNLSLWRCPRSLKHRHEAGRVKNERLRKSASRPPSSHRTPPQRRYRTARPSRPHRSLTSRWTRGCGPCSPGKTSRACPGTTAVRPPRPRPWRPCARRRR
ncbi:hypothetical protein BC628DRAFT_1359859 [Trametes gibbosa]|nr:hypothetical protein BC628DRAFT_1359859 [Trametes gibbosa]